jgi:ketosteroid isomerase-like protein
MSSRSRRAAGLLLVVLPTVAFGGVSILRLLIHDPAYMRNPLRQDLWRAGHAHAGVLLVLSLVALRYVDEARLSEKAKSFVRAAIPAAAIFLPAAFFFSVLDPHATAPNGWIRLAYVGGAFLAAGVVLLGIGLIRAGSPGGGASSNRGSVERFHVLWLALLLGAFAASAGARTPNPGPAPAAALPSVDLPGPLARLLRDYESAWRARDAAALAALFAEDGFVLTGGSPPVRGRAAIEKAYAGMGGPLELRALAFATEGAIGYIVGGFAREKGEPDVGKFTLTLHRGEDGRWRIFSDMDNSNQRSR